MQGDWYILRFFQLKKALQKVITNNFLQLGPDPHLKAAFKSIQKNLIQIR